MLACRLTRASSCRLLTALSAAGSHLIVAVLALPLLGCRSELDLYKDQGPRYEARSWLRTNLNPHPFASNRFESKAAIVAFVDSLYLLGADTVYVLNVLQEPDRIQEEGGARASIPIPIVASATCISGGTDRTACSAPCLS